MGAEVLVVVGASGGVGASTLAALLARRRSVDGRRVALVDLHEGRGGVDVLLGVEDRPGLRWADLATVRGAVGASDLEGLLPLWEGVEVLSADGRGGRPSSGAVLAVWSALVDGCSTVVVDVPAHRVAELSSEVVSGEAMVAVDPAVAGILADRSDLVVVTGQDVVGVAAALPVRAAVRGGPAQLVLRRRRGARVAGLEAAHVLDLPLLCLLPHDRGVALGVDRGLGPVPAGWSRLGRAVTRVARGVGHG